MKFPDWDKGEFILNATGSKYSVVIPEDGYIVVHAGSSTGRAGYVYLNNQHIAAGTYPDDFNCIPVKKGDILTGDGTYGGSYTWARANFYPFKR